ncbi:MAG: L,D-transpeptidase family protein [Solirubrobacteraceae bacterium]
MSRRRLVVVVISAAVAVGAAIALVVVAGAQAPLPGERIAAGVTAASVDVSGLTPDEAAAKLQGAYGDRLANGAIVVQAAGLTWRLTAGGAHVAFDPLRSARRALYAGRAAAGQPVDVPLAVTFSKGTVKRFAARIDRRLYRAARDARLKLSIRRVRVTHSSRGRDINSRALKKQIWAALTDPRVARVLEPPLIAVKPKVTADKLRRTAATAITIQQSTFTLRLFKSLRVVKTYKVAVGQPAYPTPRGLFSVGSKQVNPVWSVPNSPWAGELAGTTVVGGSAANPLKARWMGLANGVGIHGTGEDYSIGTRASHGCIRMHVGDVVALYKRVPVGTPVLIG